MVETREVFFLDRGRTAAEDANRSERWPLLYAALFMALAGGLCWLVVFALLGVATGFVAG
ncbi:MAG: hypothetical protein KDG89_00600 [Geminicoccaceae bacterium]|nr:hypothetical protein [Geminicoccaceae bacterium]